MKTSRRLLTLAASLALSLGVAQSFSQPASAQGGKSGVERLYVLNCGEGVAGDISRWSPGLNDEKSMDFVDNCYLMHHTQGWLLWDTGVTDAIAAMPDGQAPSDPRMTHWRRPKTLASQLELLGVKPADIKYLAVSHTHPDHIGNVELFPQTMLLVQKAEYDWPSPSGPRFKPTHPVTKLEGDHDVFGDGSVTISSTLICSSSTTPSSGSITTLRSARRSSSRRTTTNKTTTNKEEMTKGASTMSED